MPEKSEIGPDDLRMGFELLCMWSRNLAMLPLEEWRNALDHAETVAPFIDPTLYRDYLYSKKAKILKELLDAAIDLKAVVLKHQDTVRMMMAEEREP